MRSVTKQSSNKMSHVGGRHNCLTDLFPIELSSPPSSLQAYPLVFYRKKSFNKWDEDSDPTTQ